MDNRYRKRIKMKEDTFIFSQSRPKNTNSIYYTFLGDHDFLDKNGNPCSNEEDNDKVLAKLVVRDDGSQKYIIKVDYAYKPYNPISIYGNKQAYKNMDKTRPESKFITVNKEAFDHYVKFLKTRIVSWLHNTERSI